MKDQHIFNLEDGHVKIRGVYIGLPIERAQQMPLDQGFNSDFKGNIEGLGICRVTIRGERCRHLHPHQCVPRRPPSVLELQGQASSSSHEQHHRYRQGSHSHIERNICRGLSIQESRCDCDGHRAQLRRSNRFV